MSWHGVGCTLETGHVERTDMKLSWLGKQEEGLHIEATHTVRHVLPLRSRLLRVTLDLGRPRPRIDGRSRHFGGKWPQLLVFPPPGRSFSVGWSSYQLSSRAWTRLGGHTSHTTCPNRQIRRARQKLGVKTKPYQCRGRECPTHGTPFVRNSKQSESFVSKPTNRPSSS